MTTLTCLTWKFSKMSSTNEWSKLRSVVVGVADNAKIPELEVSLRCVNFADRQDTSSIRTGAYPKQVVEEANEDLDIFCDFLKGENVEVLRPERTDCKYYNYCPRDSVFIYHDFTIATPMPIKARKGEWKAFQGHLKNTIEITENHSDELYNLNCVGNKDILALNELQPAFDAANIIRADGDILYQVSNSGNQLGATLLQEVLGSSTHVRLLKDVYSYMHIDSTIAFLQEGLLLANPSRIKNKDDLPEPFSHWDIIFAPEPVDVGHYKGICSSSVWTWNLNLFSVNENLVALEEHQHPTRKLLEARGIECAMLPMRHARTLGGCFHCVTLDLERG